MSRYLFFVVLLLLAHSCGSKSNKDQTPISEDQDAKENIELTEARTIETIPAPPRRVPSKQERNVPETAPVITEREEEEKREREEEKEVREDRKEKDDRKIPESIVFRATTWQVVKDADNLKLTTRASSIEIERLDSEWLKLECDRIQKVIEQSLYAYEVSCKNDASENFRSCQLAASTLFFSVKLAEHLFRPTYPFDMVEWNEDTWRIRDSSNLFDESYIKQLKNQAALELGLASTSIEVEVLSPDVYFGEGSGPKLVFADTKRSLEYKNLQDLVDRFAKETEKFSLLEFSVSGNRILTKNRLLSCDLINQKVFLTMPFMNGDSNQSNEIKIYATKETKQ
ncbi:MAG: hypothetical protein KBD78_12385 [Oligoflexales bacterium]|nr:hypothetical protein [Oligoflexales bacterium]